MTLKRISISLRVPPDELEDWKAAARREKRSLTGWIRYALDFYLRIGRPALEDIQRSEVEEKLDSER